MRRNHGRSWLKAGSWPFLRSAGCIIVTKGGQREMSPPSRGLLNRSAVVVKPRQRFLDWLHGADPTSPHLTLRDLAREPTLYLLPEWDTEAELEKVLREVCEQIFCEQLAGWFNDTAT